MQYPFKVNFLTSFTLKKVLALFTVVSISSLTLLGVLSKSDALEGLFNLQQVADTSVTEVTLTIAASQMVNQDGTAFEESGKRWVGTGQNPEQSYLGIYFENVNLPSNAL